jgi:hypothetical protein
MIERLVTVLGGGNEHAEVVTHTLLAAVLVKRGWAKATVDVEVICRELARHGTRPPMAVAGTRHVVEEILFLSLPRHRLPPILLSAN